ncbi:hypothetical protein O181_018518 [Austropuccinia psidii MF-1]|uniref:Uncharacterized protein n=1 Tax=Austropuccinia psidii MF-1 TaxID=1389203 RepID=A0A9Q3C814_9BASI|nr:hypothetical protein [Austropuccinia psidii MF-1]
MSSKLTELTEYSPSVLPTSFLCGSGIFSLLGSPWSMASSGHFDPSQTYDGYKAVEALDPACTEFLKKGKQCFQHYDPCSSKFQHCFVGKKPFQCPGDPLSNVRGICGVKNMVLLKKSSQFLRLLLLMVLQVTGSRQRDVSRWTNVGRPIYYSSEVPIFRINSQGGVKRLRRISDSPTNPNSEGSNELVGEGVEVVPNSIGQQSSASPSKPASRRFQSQVIPSSPRNFQPVLSAIPSSIPPPSPNPSTSRPPLASQVRPSPIPQHRISPIVTS